MPRRRIQFRAGEYYHLYNRGINKSDIFLSRENYYFFLRKVREHLADGVCEIIAYCLMPNHYHLLVRLLVDEFSEGMKSLGLSYAKAFNKAHDRVGPLFQGPFKAVHVNAEPYLLHLTRYIHLNPISAGLCKRVHDWEFSSYLEYIGRRNGTLPGTELILREFASSEEYRQFVEDGIGMTNDVISHLAID